ncbi:MAG: sugar phosphate isomerase/epimerase [Firmicutes bacterium]|nr:sugar phosphate isomerase/epimerase [Bacillota bacterium]
MKLSFEIWPNDPYAEMGIVGVPINSWGDKPIEWCVAKVAEYGYKGVDFFYDKFLELPPDEYDRVSKTLGDFAASKGLEIPSIGAHHLVLSPRAWERKPRIQTVKRAIDLAASIRAKTVVAYIAGYYNPPTYMLMSRKEATRIFVEMVKECAEYAGERGLTFSIEPHQETLINTPDATLEIIDQIGLDNIRVTIDFGGLELGMKPHMPIREALSKFGKLINHVHAKDITGVIGRWNMCWFGGGMVNFKEYADAFRAIGYDGYICVEWEGWFRGGLEGVGDMAGHGLGDFDRVAVEAKEFLERYFA